MWLIVLAGLGILLSFGTPAQAAVETACVGGNGGTFTVPTDGIVPDGYDNVNCNLVVNASVTPTAGLLNFRLRAATITVAPVAPQTPPLTIVNTSVGGDVSLVATGGANTSGNISIANAAIKAKDQVNIECSKPNCTVTVTATSSLIASTTVDIVPDPLLTGFGGPGGTLQVTADGNVSITGTSVWGGSLVKIRSVNGGVTFQCTGGGVACKDPTLTPPPIVIQNCGNPPVYPCTLPPLSEADLQSICIQGGGGVTCGGGSKEFDIIAKDEINIENTALTVDAILVIKSDRGPIKGAGAVLDALILNVSVNNGTGTPAPLIDFTNASLTAANVLTIIVKGGCPAAPAVSIQLTGATILSGIPPTISACKGGVIVGP
jgi:hypothetical protein